VRDYGSLNENNLNNNCQKITYKNLQPSFYHPTQVGKMALLKKHNMLIKPN
jgi:hypothetical protein